MRPHWWAVLAVSLALLALVAAASSDRPPASGIHDLANAAGPRHQPPATTLPSSTTTTAPPTVTTTTVPPSTTTTSDVARVVVQESSPTTTTTTTTTTVPPPANAAAAPVQAITPEYGSLQQPHDTSATYMFTGQGAMQVAASWTPSTTLSLTVSCPGSTQQVEGTSTASVVIPGADGPCDAVLKEIAVQNDGVSYTLTIGPQGG